MYFIQLLVYNKYILIKELLKIMMFKFIEMLYEMYGDGYEDAIECFAETEIRKNPDLGLDELFIKWAEFLQP